MDASRMLAGRYRLDGVLGRGGMATVWRAQDEVLDRPVAVKVVHLGGDDPAASARFAREVRTAAALAHPNIVTVFDAGTEADSGEDVGVAFLVMELLPGPTLSALLAARGPLPVDEAISYASGTASALGSAHAAGVVHRDIKPANLMLDAGGQVRVLDFGIARLLESTGTQLTATGAVMGTAAYLAPEQVAGRPADARTDVYALGCVLMALLTGQPPFVADHPMGVVTQHLGADPPRLDERLPDAPPALTGLVAAMLAKDPADRPQTAAAVHAALRDIARGHGLLPGQSTQNTATQALPAAAPAGTQVLPAIGLAGPTVARTGAARPTWQRPVALTAGAVVAALLLVLAVAALTARTEDEPNASAGGPSSPGSAPASPTSTSSPPATPTTPAEPATSGTGQQLAALADSVQAAVGSRDLESKAADDLNHRVDDVTKKLQEGKTDEIGRKLRDFADRLDKLTREGKLTPAGASNIQGPLAALQQKFPGAR